MQNICVPHKTIFPLIFKFLPPFHFEILFNLSVLILSIAFTETETGCEYDVSKQPDLLTGEDPGDKFNRCMRRRDLHGLCHSLCLEERASQWEQREGGERMYGSVK